jgi:hypothetical protein
MRVGDQDSVGMDVRREIIPQPNPARVGIDENLSANWRGHAETGMGDVLDGYRPILPHRGLTSNLAVPPCNDREYYEQKRAFVSA